MKAVTLVIVLAVTLLTTILADTAARKCYECRIEVPPKKEGSEQVPKYYDLEGEDVKEACGVVTCGGGVTSCATIIDEGNVEETGPIIYQKCNDEDELCDFVGIDEQVCNVTTCDTGDLCNKYSSSGRNSLANALLLTIAALVLTYL